MLNFIEVDGTKYPVIININVLAMFQYETGVDIDEFYKNVLKKLYLIEPLLYASIKEGQLILKEPVIITREQTHLLLSDDDVYSKFIEILGKNAIKSEDKLEDKKKLV
jgi:hypothetical protein